MTGNSTRTTTLTRTPLGTGGGAEGASRRAPKARLGNVIDTSSAPADDGPNAADARWAVHRAMWRASPLKRVRLCRRYAADPDAETLPLRMSTSDDGTVSVGFGGVKVCGSWSCCMTCGAKIAVRRAELLAHIFTVWQALGGTVVLATFTARHHAGQSLEELVTGLRAGWKAVRSGRPWARDVSDLGINWTIRAFESTAGDEHGWHPHFHAFFLVDGPVSEECARAVTDRYEKHADGSVTAGMWERWCEGLATQGMSAVASVAGKKQEPGEEARESAGFDVRVLQPGDDPGELARYPFKMALEAVGGVFKRGRQTDAKGNPVGRRHRTPFEIMESYAVAVAEGDTEGARKDFELITEWCETATRMRFRQCPLPPGMREQFADKARELGIPGPLLDAEQSDEQIAEDEVAGSETLGHVPVGAYTGTVVYEMDTLRAAARSGGVPAVVAWFAQRHIPLELTGFGQVCLLGGTGPPALNGGARDG